MGSIGRTLGGGLLGATRGLGSTPGMGPFGGGLVGQMLARAGATQTANMLGKKGKKKKPGATPAVPPMGGVDY